MLSDRWLSVCLVLSVTLCIVATGQTVGWIKMKHDTQIGLGPGQIALDADPPPPPPKGHSLPCPNFRHISVVAKRVDESRWHLASQPRRLCVRWGASPPPQKGAEPPRQFSAHFSCGQTAAWIKMPLATEVGLGLGNIVLDGDPASPPQNGAEPPAQLWSMSIVAKRLDGSR